MLSQLAARHMLFAAMLAIGASSSTPTVGRYQVGGTASQGFVIDTVTGQVWTKFTSSGSGTTDNDFALPKHVSR